MALWHSSIPVASAYEQRDEPSTIRFKHDSCDARDSQSLHSHLSQKNDRYVLLSTSAHRHLGTWEQQGTNVPARLVYVGWTSWRASASPQR